MHRLALEELRKNNVPTISEDEASKMKKCGVRKGKLKGEKVRASKEEWSSQEKDAEAS